MKNGLKKILSVSLTTLLALSASACGFGKTEEETASIGYSYLTIDINPSLELLVNDEIVVSVKACNEDAAVLLYGEELENMTVESATEKIVDLAEDLGYLTEENDDVKITVSADEEDWIKQIVEKAKKGAQKGSELAKINNSSRSADVRMVKKLQAEAEGVYDKLTPEKLRLIETIMEYDETMTYEIGATMKVQDLVKLLNELSAEYKDVVGDEMKELFQNKYDQMKQLAEDRLASVFGEDYEALWTRYVALEKAVRIIEEKAKNMVVSEEDKLAIMELLGLVEPTEETEETEETEHSEQPEETEQPEQTEEIEETEQSEFGRHEEQNRQEQGGKVEDQPPQFPQGLEKPKIDEEGKKDHVFGDGWKMKEFDHYFDRNFHEEKFEKDDELDEKIEEILKAYDKENYVLTQEDLASITEAWGEAIEITTFGELEEFVEDVKEDLKEIRENAELSATQQGEVEVVENSLEGFRKMALSEMQEELTAYREKLHGMKQERMKK